MARGRKACSEASRFYVYRLYDDPVVTLYVGKGSGRRLQAQKRNFRCNGEIMGWFDRERDAYAREVELIAELRPAENKNRGGFGGMATPRRIPRKSGVEREMERVGPRRYVARQLLGFDLSSFVCQSKIDAIRQVADGPRI